jgi:hypothetical protein
VGRVIGLDISKRSAEVAMLQPGTGEMSAPRKPRQPKSESQTTNPAQRGEDEYVRFLHERFGEAGPRGIDHPNSPKAKTPPRRSP